MLNQIYQDAKNAILIVVALILLSFAYANAETNDVWIEDAGLVIIDANGQGELNHLYKVHCDKPGYIVSIEIVWPDSEDGTPGAVEYRSGEYCGTVIYLTGTAALATVTIASVVAPEPESVYRVWLPILAK